MANNIVPRWGTLVSLLQYAHTKTNPLQYFFGNLKSEKLVIQSGTKNLNINVLRFFTLFKMTKYNGLNS
ncbi:MAG: hypothetical protein PHT69_04180 [Bacteroidales bacterium]|nr:hypothetical protein [Bacteroidales bacterium]